MNTEILNLIKSKIQNYSMPKSGNRGIYIIYNVLSKKYYIGSAKTFNKRINAHFKDLEKGKGINQHLQVAFNKYGKDSFIFELVEFIEKYQKEYFLERETFWIKALDSINIGYNITLANFGGDTLTNHPYRLELNRKRGETAKRNNKLLSKEEYNKRYGVGIKRSPYPKDFGKTISALKSGKNHHFFNKHLSEEHKEKLSNLFSGSKNPEAKSYSINGEIFLTRKDAVNKLGISAPTLRKRCNSDDVKWAHWKCLGHTKNLEVCND